MSVKQTFIAPAGHPCPRTGAHPMSAGRREPNGRRARADLPETGGPTPELLDRLRERGPTQMISRYRAYTPPGWTAPVIPNDDAAMGFEALRKLRLRLGVAEARCPTLIGRLMGGTFAAAPVNEVDRPEALRRLRAAAAELGPAAYDAAASVCDDRPVADVGLVREASETLARLFVRPGPKKFRDRVDGSVDAGQ